MKQFNTQKVRFQVRVHIDETGNSSFGLVEIIGSPATEIEGPRSLGEKRVNASPLLVIGIGLIFLLIVGFFFVRRVKMRRLMEVCFWVLISASSIASARKRRRLELPPPIARSE